MNLLLKKVRIIYPGHPLHRKKTDLLIRDGIIKRIGKSIRAQKATTIEYANLHLSPGWMDINTFIGEPGYEHRDTYMSLTQSARAGGYTSLATAPNTFPVADQKTAIHFQLKQQEFTGINIYPLGAVTVNAAGKDIAELIDMKTSGAVGFSDGFGPIQNNGVMMRALQYVKSFDGIVLNHPHDYSLAEEGLIHEGAVSTSLGMKGIPSLAEELMLQRDLDLLSYTNSKLHALNISCKESVELIARAKSNGLAVTASVPVMNLVATDAAVTQFDYQFKVLPPLRPLEDQQKLFSALKTGVLDGINTNHVPVDEEHKKLEFAHSAFGAIGLETAFALLNTKYPKELDLWIDCLALRNRTILELPPPTLEVGAKAEVTIFDPGFKWQFTKQDIHSLSKNSAYIGASFQGKVLGTVNGAHTYLDRALEA